MDISEARDLAHELMEEYLDGTWGFKFDQAKRRFGLCSYRNQTISLSAPLVRLNDREQVSDTIRHEIAHAISGHQAGHGRIWKQACYVTGANPERCYDSSEIVTPETAWRLECSNPDCDVTYKRHRRTTRAVACGRCCKLYNGNKFSRDYLMVYVRNTDIASN